MWWSMLSACAIDPDAFAAIPAEDVDTPRSAVDDAVLKVMEAQQLPGLGVGIVEDGALTYARGYGWQTWPDTAFSAQTTKVRWASLSKSVTAAVAADAAVRGTVDLDMDVATLRPAYTPPANWDGESPITLRRLLGHLGGTRHYGDDPLDDGSPPASKADDPDVNTGMAWALPYWEADDLVNQPGEAFHYSSFGYNLAGVVLEDQLGAPLDDLARALVFDPLGMDSMGPDFGWVDDPDRASGYTHDVFGGVVPAVDTDVSWKLASGGWHSTTADLARWCAGFMGDTVLGEEAKAQLWTEGETLDGEGTDYGLGFFLYGDHVGHSGGNEKASTLFRAWPEEGRCVVLMANAEYAALGGLMDTLTAE